MLYNDCHFSLCITKIRFHEWLSSFNLKCFPRARQLFFVDMVPSFIFHRNISLYHSHLNWKLFVAFDALNKYTMVTWNVQLLSYNRIIFITSCMRQDHQAIIYIHIFASWRGHRTYVLRKRKYIVTSTKHADVQSRRAHFVDATGVFVDKQFH